MATKERTPIELARFFFILTVFGVVAWIALAVSMLQSETDPLGVQTHDYATSVWLVHQETLRKQHESFRARNPESMELAQR